MFSSREEAEVSTVSFSLERSKDCYVCIRFGVITKWADCAIGQWWGHCGHQVPKQKRPR